MARAKQSRRIARTWAALLGEAAGIDAVDDFRVSALMNGDDDAEASESLLATIASDQLGWDESASNAGAAKIDHCPKGYEDHYYEAYQTAAVAYVLELAA